MAVDPEPEVLAVIPARSGSKGIPHKNILPFRGKPLMAHSIEHARAASSVRRIIVSTDSPTYAQIAREHGAEVPFLRPESLSGDLSTDLEVFQHALGWLEEHEGYRPDICVHLRPTYPNRRPEDVDEAVRLLQVDPAVDSVRSVAPAPFTPFKMWFLGSGGLLAPCVSTTIAEAYNQPRQSLPQAYAQTASIDVVWSHVVRGGSMTGKRVRALVMERTLDIDTLEEFRAAELETADGLSGRRFVIDIDGVIASLVPDNDYAKAQPMLDNIRLINELHDGGNQIVLFTARGSATGIDWTGVTATQLSTWGVRFHELRFGKPAGDYYVDDRMIGLDDLRRAVWRRRASSSAAEKQEARQER
jgi:CMP-N,N'-diacetyllegionaminic acid synthase